MITAVIFIPRLIQRHAARTRYRAAALQQLQQSFDRYRQGGNEAESSQQQLSEQVLAILRRCALTTGVSDTANRSASLLLRHLDQLARAPVFGEHLAERMDQLAYAKSPQPLTDTELADLHQRAIQWIKQLGASPARGRP